MNKYLKNHSTFDNIKLKVLKAFQVPKYKIRDTHFVRFVRFLNLVSAYTSLWVSVVRYYLAGAKQENSDGALRNIHLFIAFLTAFDHSSPALCYLTENCREESSLQLSNPIIQSRLDQRFGNDLF